MTRIYLFCLVLLQIVILARAADLKLIPGADKQNDASPAIVIIGAGYAGLGAAYGLTKLHGFQNVVVLEALDRVGGRVDTIRDEKEGYFDMGAQFLHSLQSETFGLLTRDDNLIFERKLRQRARRLKRAKRQESANNEEGTGDNDENNLYDETIALMPTGVQIPSHVIAGWSELYGKLTDEGIEYNGLDMNIKRRDPEPNPVSVKTYWAPFIADFKKESETSAGTEEQRADFQKYNRWLDDFIERWVKWDYAVLSMEDTSVYAYAWEDTYPDEEYVEISLGKYGYLNVTETFVGQIPPGTIKLNANVTKVEWNRELMTVRTDDGRSFEANHVIVTSSLGYLANYQNTLFEPNLNERKTGAIEAIGKGCMEKVFLLYEKRFWPDETNIVFFYPDVDADEKESDQESLEDQIQIISAMPDEVHPNVLELWLPYPSVLTLRELSDEQLIQVVTDKFAKYKFGSDNPPKPYKVIRSNWCADTMTQNSYGCYFSTEFDRGGYTQADLIEPISIEKDGKQKPLILFAGEAMAGVPATAHGAYWTGLRESRRIARYYTLETQFKERLG